MCVLLHQSAFPLLTGLRRAKNFNTSVFQIHAFWNFCFCFFEKLNKAGNSEFLAFSNFENLDFLLGGTLINVFMSSYSLELYFEEAEFVIPQKLGHNQFFSTLYFCRRHLIFMNQYTWKKAKFWEVGFPQIYSNFRICLGFNFTVCFIRKVHREAFPKSTYLYSRIFGALKS